MHIFRSFGHILGGTLLIAGTSIGVGMLALPVVTAEGGFLPSILVYVVCWLFMLISGLLLVEACLWMPKGSNLMTLASKLLGRGGKVACWILYLFLFSCLMVAHVAGGGSVLQTILHGAVPLWLSTLVYALIFAPVVYMGTLWVDRLNLILMAGIGVTYIALMTSSLPSLNWNQLGTGNFSKAILALPVIFTAFGYQSLIPTLMDYLDRNLKKMRIIIIAGTSIPLVIYVLWEMLVLGTVPLEGDYGLLSALKKGDNAVASLGHFLKNDQIAGFCKGFAFFALTTSFIGIGMAFVDFLLDGFRVKKTQLSKLTMCSCVFLLPVILTWIDPHLFLVALDYAGGIGVALLLGAMPILMVWSGRYYHGHSLLHRQVPGGKIVLSVLMVFVVIELFITVFA